MLCREAEKRVNVRLGWLVAQVEVGLGSSGAVSSDEFDRRELSARFSFGMPTEAQLFSGTLFPFFLVAAPLKMVQAPKRVPFSRLLSAPLLKV